MRDTERRVRAQYEAWLAGRGPVASYVRWYLRHARAHHAPALFAAIGDRPLASVLDVGCATGVYLSWAHAHGHGATLLAGVDLSPTYGGAVGIAPERTGRPSSG